MVESFLARTLRIDQTNSEELRGLVGSGLDRARESVQTETDAKRENVARGLRGIVQDVLNEFDKELESHQGRMSKRGACGGG